MHSDITSLLSRLKSQDAVFTDVLDFINRHYDFSETAFSNGAQKNAEGENAGSCRVFAFAQMHDLSAADTLMLFAEHYRDVLDSPTNDNHQNIRQFMQHGWGGIKFAKTALTKKS